MGDLGFSTGLDDLPFPDRLSSSLASISGSLAADSLGDAKFLKPPVSLGRCRRRARLGGDELALGPLAVAPWWLSDDPTQDQKPGKR